MDYSKCCIYKIEHIEDDNLVYVGHTTNWDKRKSYHKGNCNNKKNKAFNHKLYQMIRDNGNWNMFRMIEIEKYPCNDKREAERRENEVMKKLKANMNTYKSFTTDEERKEEKKEWRLNNKEKVKEHDSRYYKNNKEKINEKQNQYYENHKEQIIEHSI